MAQPPLHDPLALFKGKCHCLPFLHSCGKEKENAIGINFVKRLSCSNNSSLFRLYRLYDSQRFGGWLWAKTETFSIMFFFFFWSAFFFSLLGGLFFFFSFVLALPLSSPFVPSLFPLSRSHWVCLHHGTAR